MFELDPQFLIELRDYIYVSLGFLIFLVSFICGRFCIPR